MRWGQRDNIAGSFYLACGQLGSVLEIPYVSWKLWGVIPEYWADVTSGYCQGNPETNTHIQRQKQNKKGKEKKEYNEMY